MSKTSYFTMPELIMMYAESVKKYVDMFGLKSYRITLQGIADKDNDSPAGVDLDTTNREAKFYLNSDTKEIDFLLTKDINKEYAEDKLDEMAFHEVIEVLLIPIHEVIRDKYLYNAEEFESALIKAKHIVVVTLENVVRWRIKDDKDTGTKVTRRIASVHSKSSSSTCNKSETKPSK